MNEETMNEVVELEKGGYDGEHYYCAITRDLDHMSNLDANPESLFKHYVIYDKWSLQYHVLDIRVPGGTVGGISFDDDGVITELSVQTDYVVKTYFRNVNKHLRKYIGMKLNLPEIPKEKR